MWRQKGNICCCSTGAIHLVWKTGLTGPGLADWAGLAGQWTSLPLPVLRCRTPYPVPLNVVQEIKIKSSCFMCGQHTRTGLPPWPLLLPWFPGGWLLEASISVLFSDDPGSRLAAWLLLAPSMVAPHLLPTPVGYHSRFQRKFPSHSKVATGLSEVHVPALRTL